MSRFLDILRVHTVTGGAVRTELVALGPSPSDGLPDPHRSERDALKHADELNDSAHFLMIFARFEKEVRSRAKALVEANQRQDDWKLARSWTILDPEKMDFRRALGLLMPMGGPDFQYVISLYRDRNIVAHGDLLEEKPQMPVIAEKLEAILNRLQDAP